MTLHFAVATGQPTCNLLYTYVHVLCTANFVRTFSDFVLSLNELSYNYISAVQFELHVGIYSTEIFLLLTVSGYSKKCEVHVHNVF